MSIAPVRAGNFTGVTEPLSSEPSAVANETAQAESAPVQPPPRDPALTDTPAPTNNPPATDPAALEQAPALGTNEVDLDAIEQDLSGVEVALSRLAEGTYWTDEVTGSTIPDSVLAADPIARRV